MRTALLIICVASLAACDRSVQVESPWYSIDVEFAEPGSKKNMFDRLTLTIGDCGFKVVNNPAVGMTAGRATLFRFFATRDDRVAADLHDAHGQTVLSISLFLSGFIDEEHASECWKAIQADLQAGDYEIPP